MSTIHVLLISNDHILELDSLKNELTGLDLNGATVTVTLVDAAGAQVGGEVWPKAMTYVAETDGVYRCTLPYTLALSASGRYTARITANAGNGLRAQWDMECVARTRN